MAFQATCYGKNLKIMFTFFHRKSKIYLDCFTTSSTVFNFTPPVKTSKTFPEWWINLPKKIPVFDYTTSDYVHPTLHTTNMRTCYGFVELFKKGLIIENFFDINIKTTEDNIRYMYEGGFPPQTHPSYQLGDGFKNYYHLKINNPWLFSEKTGVHFLLIGASWHLENYDFIIPPGVLRFDIQASANINMFFPKKNNMFSIPKGQPLAQIIPLSEKKLVIRKHLITKDEAKSRAHNTALHGWYGIYNTLKLYKRNKKREESKCPFGFKKD